MSAEEIRSRILELVGEFAAAQWAERPFEPGVTPVPVSGKVFDGGDVRQLVGEDDGAPGPGQARVRRGVEHDAVARGPTVLARRAVGARAHPVVRGRTEERLALGHRRRGEDEHSARGA